jgi:hypothetical protein
MLSKTGNIEYDNIFFNNKEKLILHFKIVLDKLMDRFDISDDIKTILENGVELCQDYLVISPQDRLQGVITSISIILKYFKDYLKDVTSRLKNDSENNVEILLSDKTILTSVIKRYEESLIVLNTITI